MRIAYYVSAHGFGHMSRSSVVIAELLLRSWVDCIHVSSNRVDFLNFESPNLKKRRIKTDVGMAQRDSLSIDIPRTLLELHDFYSNQSNLLKSEIEWIKRNNIDLIITDVSSFPILLGLELSIPVIFVGNFTWDGIYEHYQDKTPAFKQYSEKLKVEYSFASEAFLLPFSMPMTMFLEKKNIGLVARRTPKSKQETRKSLGFSDNQIYILLSFGAYGLEESQLQWKEFPKGFVLVSDDKTIEHPLVQKIESIPYPEIVKAVDCVITKPGYGILSETLIAGTPILTTDRGDFAEVPYLIEGLESFFSWSHVPRADFLLGNFIPYLENAKSKKALELPFQLHGEKDIADSLEEYA